MNGGIMRLSWIISRLVGCCLIFGQATFTGMYARNAALASCCAVHRIRSLCWHMPQLSALLRRTSRIPVSHARVSWVSECCALWPMEVWRCCASVRQLEPVMPPYVLYCPTGTVSHYIYELLLLTLCNTQLQTVWKHIYVLVGVQRFRVGRKCAVWRAFIHTCVHTVIHTYTHICMHTYIPLLVLPSHVPKISFT